MQFDFGTIDPYVVDGIALANIINTWRDAQYSYHRGPTRPSYIVPGQLWIDDSAGATGWVLKQFISPALGDVPLFTINTVTAQITLASTLRGVTQPSATDNSLALATTAFVQNAVAAGIAAALSTLMPVGTIFDVPGILIIAPTGFVLSGPGTIGSAVSGATLRANADCQPLYAHLYTLNNAEAPVSGGRGASATDDFLAGKTIGGLDFRGVARATFDSGAGRLSAFSRVGQIGGEQVHTLSYGEMPNHNHALFGGLGINDPGHDHDLQMWQNSIGGTGGGASIWGDGAGRRALNSGSNLSLGGSYSVGAAGGNGGHNNIQPTRTVTTLVKL